MGVLNVTPDSFSDGGSYEGRVEAVNRARAIFDAGADVLDVGGESTRPGATPVGAERELARVIPIIQELNEMGLGPISIDTTKAEVARRALEAGALIVNDISGFRFDPEIAQVVAESDATVIIGHTRGPPSTMQEGHIEYEGGVVAAVEAHWDGAVRRAESLGIARDRMWLDPGFGFGKTMEHNLELLRALPRFRRLGHRLVVGLSRKGFIGTLTGRPVEERIFGSVAAAALAAYLGADVIRAHDVEATRDALRIGEAVRPKGSGDL
jgi:dihydropteroate synthase